LPLGVKPSMCVSPSSSANFGKPAASSAAEARGLYRPAYLARLQTLSDRRPEAVEGLVTFNSSPDTLMGRFDSVPTWFGNMLPSLRTVKVLSASFTDQDPNVAVVPCTAAAF
jgi:hypothetical protein